MTNTRMLIPAPEFKELTESQKYGLYAAAIHLLTLSEKPLERWAVEGERALERLSAEKGHLYAPPVAPSHVAQVKLVATEEMVRAIDKAHGDLTPGDWIDDVKHLQCTLDALAPFLAPSSTPRGNSVAGAYNVLSMIVETYYAHDERIVGYVTQLGEALKGESLTASATRRIRRLLNTDGHCPSCGHNRNTSSVSSIDNDDGTHYCQKCSAEWEEIP